MPARISKQFKHIRPLARSGLCALVFTALAGCSGETSDSNPTQTSKLVAQRNAVAASPVSVVSIRKLSETRIGRTTYDYVFAVTLINTTGQSLNTIKATLTGVGSGSSIIDGVVQVGTLAPGVTLTASDTITIRHDRTLPFDPAALVWSFTMAPAPSDLLGADDNGDGVRDDVQAYIDSHYAGEPAIRTSLMQLAAGLQLSAGATTQAEREIASQNRQAAAVCIADRSDTLRATALISEIKQIQFSNDARIQREIEFNRAISGSLRTWMPESIGGTCK